MSLELSLDLCQGMIGFGMWPIAYSLSGYMDAWVVGIDLKSLNE